MIVVTGSNGFIAGRLIDRFANAVEKYDLLCLDKEDCGFLFKMSAELWDQVTHLYHFGAISDTTCTDVDEIYKYNIEYSIKLFERARQHGVHVTYASSASVYGNSCICNRINPLNYYSMSKATVDMWVQDNMHTFKSIVGLRFFNVYGRGEDHKGSQASPLHVFSQQAKELGEIRVFEGSRDFKRDFVWVEDCIDCALTKKQSGIYDVGTSSQVSFMKVAELVSEKYAAPIVEIPFPDHLAEKYQFSTEAQVHFPEKKFKTVKEYVDEMP